MMNQPTIGNLMGLVTPDIQQAQQAQNNMLALASMGGGDSLSSLLGRSGLLTPRAPQLQFGVSPTDDVAGALSQGIGGGVNNFFQMRNYAQQREQAQGLMDLARAKDQAKQQADLAEALEKQRKAAETEQRIQRAVPQDLQDVYRLSDNTGQRAILSDLAGPQLASLRGQAEAQKAITSYQTKALALQEAGIDLSTSTGQNAYRAVMNFDPRTDADVEGQRLDNIGKNLSNIKAYIDTKYAPEMAAEGLRKLRTENAISADELGKLQALPEVVEAAFRRIESGEGLSQAEMLELYTTVKLMADNDPDFAGAFKDFGFIKKDKKGNFSIDNKAFKQFVTEGQVQSPQVPTPERPEAKPQTIGGMIMNDIGQQAGQVTQQVGQQVENAARVIPGVGLALDAKRALDEKLGRAAGVVQGIGDLLGYRLPQQGKPTDLRTAQQQLQNRAGEIRQKRQGVERDLQTAQQMDREISDQKAGFAAAGEEARRQLDQVNRLLEKYGGL